MNTFLVCIASWWYDEGYTLRTILQPILDLVKVDAQWGIATVAIKALSLNRCGLWPQKDDSGHIALVNDWWHLQDLWSLKVVPPPEKSHEEGNKSWADPFRKLQEWTSVMIHLRLIAPAAGSFHGRPLSVTLSLLASFQPSDTSRVLKCRQVR